ncbi:MAG: hypothetical protein P3X22_005775 [Thermoprotei archaeon]|nr:hypothetical protein [Thermoprotei archaeon]
MEAAPNEAIIVAIKELQKYGPIGLGALAFISNLVPGFPAVYISLIASYAVISPGTLQSLIAVLSAGTGAGLGKLALFAISRLMGSRFKAVRRKREELLPLLKGRKGSMGVAVFLFAALPLPDDLLYIPLGVAGFNALVFAVTVIAGKIVMAFLVYSLGYSAKWIVDAAVASMGELTLSKIVLLTALTVTLSLIVTYTIISINWLKIYMAYNEKGALEASKTLAREVADTLRLKNSKIRI